MAEISQFRPIGEPEPGFFKIQLRRGAPFVGAIIYKPCPMVPSIFEIGYDEWCQPYDRPQLLCADAGGRDISVDRVWIGGTRISKGEYLYLVHDAEWCHLYAPEDPRANPTRRVDLGEMAPIF